MVSKGKVARTFLEELLWAYEDLPQPDLSVEDLLMDLKKHAWPGRLLADIEKAFVVGYRQGIIDANRSRSLSKPDLDRG
jgi:hypothetical protein